MRGHIGPTPRQYLLTSTRGAYISTMRMGKMRILYTSTSTPYRRATVLLKLLSSLQTPVLLNYVSLGAMRRSNLASYLLSFSCRVGLLLAGQA